ncbi:MAG: response regulator [Pseudomonadota bacterium]
MNTAAATQAPPEPHSQRPNIMFVDDEERVLKSMRAMFRRDYTVHLANSGTEALALLAEHDIDVVVSDQRMPEMTGVEVLTEVKNRSPQTLRILLTGYADLAAVEASINDAEVFRYLMKPCPAEEIRGAVQEGLELGANISQTLQQPAASVEVQEVGAVVEVAAPQPLTADPQAEAVPAPAPVTSPQASTPALSGGQHIRQLKKVELLVMSPDAELLAGVKAACAGQRIHQADSVEAGLDLLGKHNIGVLVTDVSASERDIKRLSTQVRMITPDIVIIVASDRSDANVLIQMINSGQVFRFLLKPLQAGQCKIWLRSAVLRFLDNGRLLQAGMGTSVAGGPNSTLVEPGLWTRFRNWFLGVQN